VKAFKELHALDSRDTFVYQMLTHLAYMVKDAFESAENVAYFFNEQQEAFTELAVLALTS
jgi:hypothetical protein